MKFQTSKLYLLFLLFPSLFILHSCGMVEEPTTSVTCSGDCSGVVSSGTTTTGSQEVGVFVDSAVAGVTYTTSSGLSGTTNSSGQFSYVVGDTASFSIGDVSLGSVTASSVLTPVEVMGASGTADQQVINLARLLQTLDSDGDPSNGIEITTSTSNSLKGKSLNFNVPVDTFTNDSTITQIQTAVGRNLVSATSALNHLHTTLSERSLNSKISSDSKIQGLSSTLSSFSFTPTNTLAGASLAQLRASLEALATLTTTQVDKIVGAGKTKLKSDGLEKSENPGTVLPSLLSGAMSGIGQASLDSDNLTNSVISNTISVVTGLIGRFEDKLTSQASRSSDGKAAFENLLGLLMGTAVEGLANTGLSNDALDEGFGEIVGAMVSSLDEAKTDPTEMSSAVQAVTKKAVQKAASVTGLDPGAAIQATTKNAVKGLGNTKMSAADVTATLSAAVETVIDTLDEIEGDPSVNLSSMVSEVTASSVEGLADLKEDFANDQNFDVSQAVNKIAGGATKGAGSLAQTVTGLDLAAIVGNVSKSAASNLSKVTSDPTLIDKMSQGIQGGIATEADKLGNAELAQQIKEQARIPEFCDFGGKKIPGYADNNSQVVAFYDAEVNFGHSCAAKTRTCDDGQLVGFENYNNPKCVVQAPDPCTLAGQTVEHDGSLTFFEEEEVLFGSSCQSETRTCYDGTLSGAFLYPSCIIYYLVAVFCDGIVEGLCNSSTAPTFDGSKFGE